MNDQDPFYTQLKKDIRTLIEAIDGEDRKAVVHALRQIYQLCMDDDQRQRQRPDSRRRAADPNA